MTAQTASMYKNENLERMAETPKKQTAGIIYLVDSGAS